MLVERDRQARVMTCWEWESIFFLRCEREEWILMEVLYHSATLVGFDAAGGEEWALSSWWPGPFWSNRSVALLYFPVETRHKTCPRACEKATLIRARPIYLYAPRFVGVGGNLLNATLCRMVCHIFFSPFNQNALSTSMWKTALLCNTLWLLEKKG